MKAIITGASGTVGSALRKHLEAAGHTVIPWDRNAVPIDDYGKMEAFVASHQPDALFHTAVASQSTGRENEAWWVTYHWTSELAWVCRQLGVRFLFTSTVMVFTDDARGPFTPESVPDATSGYGYEKLQAEQRTLFQNPDAIVARLGWQIADALGSNNMVDYLTRQQAEHGHIDASRLWYPACSFVQDTADALVRLAVNGNPGVFLVDSNTSWTFYEIASALNLKHGNQWTVNATDSFVYDQRMLDQRVIIQPLNIRLPQLNRVG
jgi:dTDP-4-dehydrorhamnose reductase